MEPRHDRLSTFSFRSIPSTLAVLGAIALTGGMGGCTGCGGGGGEFCGDGIANGLEDCDSLDLASETCTGLGFAGGTLACAGTCSYDTGGCTGGGVCGDGTMDPGEECDDGNTIDGDGCSSLCGIEPVTCGDGTCDLAGTETCANCVVDCATDPACQAICGDGTVDGGEDCDGVNLDGNDCTTIGMGFTAGTLACSGTCTFDTSSCTAGGKCGNGSVDAGEDCDGTNLDGNDCTTIGMGFTSGTLACTGGCVFDVGACVADLCLGVDCTALDDMCNTGVCDPATGTCSAQPVTDGTACDDGALCTVGDACTTGVCQPGTVLDCSALTDMCNTGFCDTATGTCDTMPFTDGTACDDANACTSTDTCQTGVCTPGSPVDCSGLTDMCNTGMCDTASGCFAQPVSNGTGCSDGSVCTVTDTCQTGVCTGGSALDCSGLTDQCNVGMCDPTSGCFASPVANGTACDDGDACTSDACQTGTCTGTPIAVCGDGTCTAGCETIASCCGDCASCGDGTCSSCETIAGCAQDCDPCFGVSCGDGICTAGCEDVASCCTDCATCGDGTCSVCETLTSCASDCCAIEELCNDTVNNDGTGGTDCADATNCTADDFCFPNCSVPSCCYGDTMSFTGPGDNETGGGLTTGDASDGPRGAGYYFDDIEFTATAGEYVDFEVVSASFDTYLYLLDDSCNVIASNDDGGAGLLSRIEFVIPQTGVYTIVITTFSSGVTGSYDVLWQPVNTGGTCYGDVMTFAGMPDTETGGGLTAGDASNGPRGAGYYFDDIEFYGNYGQRVTLEMTAASFDTYIYLLDKDCAVVASDDDGGAGLLSLLTYQLPESGVYTLIVTTFSSGVTGTYTASWNQCSAATCCFADTLLLTGPGDTEGGGGLTAGDADGPPRGTGFEFDDIEFSAVAGGVVDLEITAQSVDTYLYLMDDNCNVIASDDDSGAGTMARLSICSMPYTGDYTVIVTTYSSGATGTYTLTWNP